MQEKKKKKKNHSISRISVPVPLIAEKRSNSLHPCLQRTLERIVHVQHSSL
ncbi:UNVERIFIED_CONTAM: hypothetical protein FKN15_078117 [Acipenser sinensis]